MKDEIRILDVESDAGDGVIVTFSDGTIGGYVVEELLELRDPTENRSESNTQIGHPPGVKSVRSAQTASSPTAVGLSNVGSWMRSGAFLAFGRVYPI
jgi:hypothetical protein